MLQSKSPTTTQHSVYIRNSSERDSFQILETDAAEVERLIYQRPTAKKNVSVIGFPVSSLSFDEQLLKIVRWAKSRLSRAVFVANAHMLVEGNQNPNFAKKLHAADLVTPDGMPLVWMISWFCKCRQDRVAGMDILLGLCQIAEQEKISVFFFGASPKTLARIEAKLSAQFPQLPVAGMETLPMCDEFTPEQDDHIIKAINESGAGIVFVALGCPKQEQWILKNRERVQAVMVGVGGAFSVYAGEKKWAPQWVREVGLEWFYRLIQDPKRLWKRYLMTNSLFVWFAFRQLLTRRFGVGKWSS